MSRLIDQAARERFAHELHENFAVNANAGSGKTTAIAHRLAGLALLPEAREVLAKTVVVTFTRKAALEIRQRARSVLMEKLAESPGHADGALEDLGSAFFGTIHSFCVLLARRFGQPLGADLDPEVVEDATDPELWEGFLETDALTFSTVSSETLDGFLRVRPLDSVFALAQSLSVQVGDLLLEGPAAVTRPQPDWVALGDLLERKSSRKGKSQENLEASQRALDEWGSAFRMETGFLPILKPLGTGNGVREAYDRFYAPLKDWCARVAGRLAAELAERYRTYRRERRIQSYDDQVELATRLVGHPDLLDRIRREGYRILLDEAQDTDPMQFNVLVEITRPPGSVPGGWPGSGEPPERGRFCLVGDAQQSIYGGRADIRNYGRHLAAFRSGSGGDILDFSVTFRLPGRLIEFLNRSVEPGFSDSVPHNRGVGDDGTCLQVPYLPLSPRPDVLPGRVSRLSFTPGGGRKVEDRLKVEMEALAEALLQTGPAGVGATDWSEISLLAPRRDWLETARECLSRRGIPASLQIRASRNGDRPAFAWIAGLLAVLVDPENGFEWVGVLREVFGVSDALLADHLDGAAPEFGMPEELPHGLREPMEVLRPFILKVDEAGIEPVRFLDDLVNACRLRERLRLVASGVGGGDDFEAIRIMAEKLSGLGGGVRDLHAQMIRALDEETPSGQAGGGCVNLLTCHSAKGLEWPVVIPIGLWRPLKRRSESGFSLVRESTTPQVYFDRSRLSEETAQSHDRELIRESMRLLYVTLTRAERHLVLPLPEGQSGDKGSFLDTWAAGDEEKLAKDLQNLPLLAGSGWNEESEEEGILLDLPKIEMPPAEQLARAREVSEEAPRRQLPHELADSSDLVRSVLHEAGSDDGVGSPDAGDPIDYGLWWHDTMEFLPWGGRKEEVELFLQSRMEKIIESAFGERARVEIMKLRKSALWSFLRSPDLAIHTEVAVFAPGRAGEWIDGVLDLLVLTEDGENDRVIDWKTNRRRSGESDQALLGRLAATYREQLAAYGRSIGAGLNRGIPSGFVYSTAAGAVIEV